MLLAIALFFCGLWLAGHPSSLPGPLRDAFVNDQGVSLTRRAYSVIERDYYRKVPQSQLVNSGIGGAVASLHDRFSHYYNPSQYRMFSNTTAGKYAGVGMTVRQVKRGLRVSDVIAHSPAARAGLRKGDTIVAAGGKSLRGKSATASTALIRGKPGTSVKLTWLHRGARTTRRVRRAKLSLPVVQSRMLHYHGDKLAYVHLNMFSAGAHGKVRDAIDGLRRKGARGIVFDLRENGGGLLNEGVLTASIFVGHGKIVSTRGRSQPRHVYDAVGGAIPRRVPVVVLVDHDTASASEIVTAALQDHHRAKVVGTRTFGKGVFQQVQPLPNGGALDITVGEFFTPNGRNLGGGGVKEGKGITPDVHTSAQGALRGGERVLARALAG